MFVALNHLNTIERFLTSDRVDNGLEEYGKENYQIKPPCCNAIVRATTIENLARNGDTGHVPEECKTNDQDINYGFLYEFKNRG